MAPRFQKLTPEMLSDIKKYVIQGRMDSGSIYPLLMHVYPNHIIFKKDLYNAVYQFWLQNNLGDSDASLMLQMLLEKKDSDPLWIIKPHLEPLSRKLNHLLWMSPQQRTIYESFHDVVFLDTTSNTNRFQMMLCVIVVIDNHFKSRIVASAIIEDETLDTFQWILMTLLEEMGINLRGGLTILQSAVIETDVDNEEIYIGLREQEQDIRQTLFKSLIKDVTQETVLEVWHVRATGTSVQLPNILIKMFVRQYHRLNKYYCRKICLEFFWQIENYPGAGPQLPLSSIYKVATSSCAAWTNERINERTYK
ncbi:hypothetical protein RhiirA4_430291 [Rhizophagus irregularis]|uniref:ZSWIM1/3 RNaseH-like domain-containing protein n=1 Tax=Rhizophagus irregularis TaxID=588596 RepID=A0A2I1HK81_9GLOM|nr:hypothetical protein RhiirA4_430291 [Rhizophagus irregularis]